MEDTLGLEREWLETDGLGGFASGTVGLVRTRRYHGLLLAASTPPTGRMMLVNGFEAHVVTSAGRYALSAQRYAPDVVHPDGAQRITRFEHTPWPRWRFELPDGTAVEQEIFAVHGAPTIVVRWRLLEARASVQLEVRPLLSGRDYHALQRENGAFRFAAEVDGERIRLQPYPDVPAISFLTNGRFEAGPDWYRTFLYKEEQARGLDCLEDLATPGVLRFELGREPAAWIVSAATPGRADIVEATRRDGALQLANALAERERERRSRFASPLHVAADAYLVSRGNGRTIVAGYPWFTDWGRDTFIALRGLCLATGRLDEAREILLEWAEAVSEGMLPNRFADSGAAPEYNAVDASLWYVVAAHELLSALDARRSPDPRTRTKLEAACEAILRGYAQGTRHRIALASDGLLAAGEPGVQLTWMDAKVGDWVVTPRVGKPVEVEALWINALAIASRWSERWRALHSQAAASFAERFWNASSAGLYDVVDVDHRAGACDPSVRPNQIFAVGGLPFSVIDGDRARAVVDQVESKLLTPRGLRSLAPGEPGYAPVYSGGVRERDGAYHQGTVWPWLLGPFVEAWVRVRGSTKKAKREAHLRFVAPVLEHVQREGLGHLCEITDAEPPFSSRGCPFQAWSLGELLRLEHTVLDLPRGHSTEAGVGRRSRRGGSNCHGQDRVELRSSFDVASLAHSPVRAEAGDRDRGDGRA